MITVCSRRADLPEVLIQSLFLDRGSQFVGRLGWDLCVSPEGLEVDSYDDAESSYVIVSDGRRHLGSCRVRPVQAGTMLMDHFAGAFPEAAPFLARQSGTLYELTRFCRDPGLSVGDSREMLRHLAVALDRFRDSRGVTGFVAVVFAPITRFLERIGVRFLRLAVSRIDGRAAHLICITHAVEAHRLLGTYDVLENEAAQEARAAAPEAVRVAAPAAETAGSAAKALVAA